ncbi:MAG: prepilin-type N-terminal cleavage/methylation domain-containing protein [Patescibacteria group bacterium]|jgi:prepilin-type N-terminal cleavage/methylation domain-containing protein
MKLNKKGFTLIELLIVVAIIGLLATLAIISLTSAQSKARDTKRISDIKSLQSAVEMYYNDNNAYPQPTSWAALETALVDQLNGALPAPPGGGVAGDQYTYGYEALGVGYCLATTLEKDNQILDQDSDGVSCGKTVTNRSSGTAQTLCTDASPFYLCIGS